MAMNLKERMQWMARTALILFILASVTFLSALMAMRYAIQGREVVVPDLVGHTQKDAQSQMAGLGVGLKIEDHVYGNEAMDTIVRQSPPPKTKVKAGSYEHVVVSLGPQKVTIPNLNGMTERTARIELLRNGMQLGEESTANFPGGPENMVIQQDPAPGTLNATSPHENVLVSAGPAAVEYVMPELVGGTLTAAESKLIPAGLKIAKITPAQAPGAQHGIVLDQSPMHGQHVDASTPIELQISE